MAGMTLLDILFNIVHIALQMHACTVQILHLEIIDVREAAGKSPNMERTGFERGMNFIMDQVSVKSVVTYAPSWEVR